MKTKSLYVCLNCGYESAKWYGRCPHCQEWSTMEEQIEQKAPEMKNTRTVSRKSSSYLKLDDVDTVGEERVSTGIDEFDRVLGGGAVMGSFVLVGGEPGIGKSTLLMQSCTNLCKLGKVLYVSGEESLRQLKLRAKRICVTSDNLFVLAETMLEDIISSVEELKPYVLIIDSIQTVFKGGIASAPGSMTQIRECAMTLMQYAKGNNIIVFIVGHVNKEGELAGPKMLEHMVDCVLYFEGSQQISYRIVRAAKNRYGSTNEIGLFEITDRGLIQVKNPSEALISGRPKDVSGSCIACIMEGSRPILAEIQALVAPSSFGTPRRMSAGFDYNRAMLLMAVLEKRAGISMAGRDAYINVIGGLRIDEPASDLPVILAIASSLKETCTRDSLVSFGEVGLTGEIRSVTSTAQRLSEIRRLGFKHCVLSKQNLDGISVPEGLKLYPVKNIREAILCALNLTK
ncbi:MAG: DNA repair protein RadA [Clostridiales bacterium]|nr:DNA repair protein RadA [Clostridiales bacterium]